MIKTFFIFSKIWIKHAQKTYQQPIPIEKRWCKVSSQLVFHSPVSRKLKCHISSGPFVDIRFNPSENQSILFNIFAQFL